MNQNSAQHVGNFIQPRFVTLRNAHNEVKSEIWIIEQKW